MKIIGIMSGTSLDGVDFVLTDVTKRGSKIDKVKYIDKGEVKFPKPLKDKLLKICENELDFRAATEVHYELGRFYEKSLNKITTKKKWKFDLIGLHGQTVFHNPPKATLQIGEPSFLTSFGVPVVANFRNKNVAFGGEGAPLAPSFHNEVFSEKNKSTVFLNIGGMTNITYMPFKGAGYATDLGPGNVFVDKAVECLYNKNFDKGGKIALSGLPDVSLVLKYVKNHSFYKRKTPKSCGREDFSDKDFKKLLHKMKKLSLKDQVATFSEITIQFLLKDLKKIKFDKLVVGGGGALNHYFLNRLTYEFCDSKVCTSEDMNWPIQAVEGGAFALLAAMKFWGIPYPKEFLFDKKPLIPLGCIY